MLIRSELKRVGQVGPSAVKAHHAHEAEIWGTAKGDAVIRR
jgi:hypothetical protein